MTTDLDERQAEAHVRAGTGQPDIRTGPGWDTFLARYRLTGIADANGNRWTVRSASGSAYAVRRRMCMDECGSYYDRWECDCPARKRCRHIDAVEAMLAAEALAAEDWDAMNELVG